MSSTNSLNPGELPVPLRLDAQIMGLVGLAHLVSHFSQLLLAPLFPWLKPRLSIRNLKAGE